MGKLESEMATLHADLDEMTKEAAICDEKAGKAMVDAAKLAAELGAEQEAAMVLSKNLPSLLLKTVRITKECKAWLKVSKPRSSLTRHKLKEQKKLPLLTWQSSAKSKEL